MTEDALSPGDTLLVPGALWHQPYARDWIRSNVRQRDLRLCVLVYDLIPAIAPHLVASGAWKEFDAYVNTVLDVADLVLVPSRATKEDVEYIASSISKRSPNVTVIRLGDALASPGSPEQMTDVPDDFILTVGTIETRKNHQLLYQTYRLAAERGIGLPPLMVVGREGWLADDVLYMLTNDPKVQSRIRLLRNVTDGQLTWLYDKCLFVVQPSVFEGWGLPVAEALSRGKVCIASRAKSMTEIAGDMIDYFSPFDADACLRLAIKFLDADVRTAAESMIRRRYRGTSWESTRAEIEQALGMA